MFEETKTSSISADLESLVATRVLVIDTTSYIVSLLAGREHTVVARGA